MKRSLISFLTIVLTLGTFGLATRTTVSASTTMTLYAPLSAAAEVPAGSSADASGTGLATITLNVTTDYYGMVTGASANFNVSLSGFPAGDQVTMAHIHIGDAQTAGAVVVNTSVGTQAFQNGSATLNMPNVMVSPSMAQQIMANPGGFYFNVHTMMSQGGAVRGQLTTTKPAPQSTTVEKAFSAQLMPGNEVPAVTGPEASAKGQGSVVLHLTEDSGGNIMSATADFSFNVSGLPASGDPIILAHVHMGAAGANGGVVISSGISPSSAVTPTGGGATFTVSGVSLDTPTAQGIVSNPAGFYFNVHTMLSPGGAMRGQLQPASNVNLALDAILSPGNEVPPVTGPEATAKGQGNVILHVTQDATGAVVAATADFS
ncbi:MAG TPA: CHRD domain-containing protein, partial [Blastocatellia bacterium]|nr:CHRD domain-containing protein [Blastocatellia bacterium]